MRTLTQTSTRLHGRWLRLARMAWVVIALLAGSVFAIGLVIRYHEFQRVCDLPVVSCNDQELLTPENAVVWANQGLSLQFYALLNISMRLFTAWVWLGAAVLIFLTRSDDWLALIVAIFLFLTGTQGGYWQAAARVFPVLTIPTGFLTNMSWVSFSLFFALFPNGRIVPRWMRWAVIIWAIFISMPTSVIDLFPAFIGGLLFMSFFASGLFAQIYRYKRFSTVTERLQTKWVIYGVTISLMGIMISYLTTLIFPALFLPGSPGYLVFQYLGGFFLVFIPLSVGLAVLRSHLWDIDVIIRRTLVYGALTVTLALVYFGLVTLLQTILSSISNQQSAISNVLSTLAIAALFTPLRRRIQSDIDRRFFRKKYDAQKALEGFAARARQETDLEQLSTEVLAVMAETLQPESLSLWLVKPTRGGRA
jgi:hypothetical protein